ncbi:MAG: hypothetical protein NUV50_10250 [Rhodospirillales bacterium]|nr:hypothetical protein [Rhodospirillales bacterium]
MQKIREKRVQSLSLALTDEQKKAIQHFWKETGSIGTVEILVDVVDDKIAPASMQVGTAK